MADERTLSKVRRVPGEAERTRDGQCFVPQVDIIEKPEELLLIADLPGARPEDIDIDYDKGELTIRGQVEPRRPAGDAEFLVQEYGVGDFRRSFQIGEGINAGQISAEVKDGVLTVTLPKAETAKPKKIAVKTA